MNTVQTPQHEAHPHGWDHLTRLVGTTIVPTTAVAGDNADHPVLLFRCTGFYHSNWTIRRHKPVSIFIDTVPTQVPLRGVAVRLAGHTHTPLLIIRQWLALGVVIDLFMHAMTPCFAQSTRRRPSCAVSNVNRHHSCLGSSKTQTPPTNGVGLCYTLQAQAMVAFEGGGVARRVAAMRLLAHLYSSWKASYSMSLRGPPTLPLGAGTCLRQQQQQQP